MAAGSLDHAGSIGEALTAGLALLGSPDLAEVIGKLPAGRGELLVEAHIATKIWRRGEKSKKGRKATTPEGD